MSQPKIIKDIISLENNKLDKTASFNWKLESVWTNMDITLGLGRHNIYSLSSFHL